MSTVFFDTVLEYIGKYIRYEAMANYAGNSFFKDSFEVISDNFPLKKEAAQENNGISALLKGVRIQGLSDGEKMPEWMAQAKRERKEKGEQGGA